MSIIEMLSPEQLAALSPEQLAALSGGAPDTTDDTKPTAKAGKRKASTAAKANAVKVPTHDTTDDNGVRWNVSMAHESRPGVEGSTVYREPRVLIRSMAQGADDYRKVTTIPATLLEVLQAIPESKVTAMVKYADEHKRTA